MCLAHWWLRGQRAVEKEGQDTTRGLCQRARHLGPRQLGRCLPAGVRQALRYAATRALEQGCQKTRNCLMMPNVSGSDVLSWPHQRHILAHCQILSLAEVLRWFGRMHLVCKVRRADHPHALDGWIWLMGTTSYQVPSRTAIWGPTYLVPHKANCCSPLLFMQQHPQKLTGPCWIF